MCPVQFQYNSNSMPAAVTCNANATPGFGGTSEVGRVSGERSRIVSKAAQGTGAGYIQKWGSKVEYSPLNPLLGRCCVFKDSAKTTRCNIKVT